MVVPRGIVRRRLYSASAIALALALYGVAALAPAEVRRRVSPLRFVGATAAAGWASLRRWSRAVRASQIFPTGRVARPHRDQPRRPADEPRRDDRAMEGPRRRGRRAAPHANDPLAKAIDVLSERLRNVEGQRGACASGSPRSRPPTAPTASATGSTSSGSRASATSGSRRRTARVTHARSPAPVRSRSRRAPTPACRHPTHSPRPLLSTRSGGLTRTRSRSA